MRYPALLLRSEAVRWTGFALLLFAVLLALVHGARPLLSGVLAALTLLVLLSVALAGILLPVALVAREARLRLVRRGIPVPELRALVGRAAAVRVAREP